MKQITKVPKLPPRNPNSHKGTYGRALIIGGSFAMTGAPALVGKAALRTGSGLVRLAVGKSVLPVVACLEPCYTMLPLDEDENGKISKLAIDKILDAAAQNDVIAFGPGCGISEGLKYILQALLKKKIKIVIDADGLNNLSQLYNWHKNINAELILTPHPGEMNRLWKSVFRQDIPKDRVQTANQFASKTDTTLVLKGHQSVVSDTQSYYINKTGNPGMATAGSGDVLTGMITSLWGQGLEPFQAAVLAVYQHGIAGDTASKIKSQASMIATDIIENIKI